VADKQLLHLVIGGELEDVTSVKFRDLAKLDLVGAYPSYAVAHDAWRQRAQATVDNAHMRYFIIHAHRLLDPNSAEDHAEGHAH
jgi:myo-inositol-1(or 4)-monophosphatase